jgi:amidase
MAEWAFSAKHTESSTFGTTRKPYNLAHVPAGSSGGTAAANATNHATNGQGTDTGNSIRGPSSHNALVGFRTTLGLISREGIVPLYLRNDVVGPMCRTVADATRVMQAMTGYDAADPITQRGVKFTPPNYTEFLDVDGLREARIGVLRELSEADVHPEVSALFNQALVDMEGLGATIVDPVVIPGFAELRQSQWCETFRADLEDFLSTYVKKRQHRYARRRRPDRLQERLRTQQRRILPYQRGTLRRPARTLRRCLHRCPPHRLPRSHRAHHGLPPARRHRLPQLEPPARADRLLRDAVPRR